MDAYNWLNKLADKGFTTGARFKLVSGEVWESGKLLPVGHTFEVKGTDTVGQTGAYVTLADLEPGAFGRRGKGTWNVPADQLVFARAEFQPIAENLSAKEIVKKVLQEADPHYKRPNGLAGFEKKHAHVIFVFEGHFDDAENQTSDLDVYEVSAEEGANAIDDNGAAEELFTRLKTTTPVGKATVQFDEYNDRVLSPPQFKQAILLYPGI